MAIKGSCHCGAVRIEVARPPLQVTRCNCSICTKLGTRWAYWRPDEVTMTGATAQYVWGDRTLAFHRCPTCGVTVAWTPLRDGIERMGVNAALLEGVDIEALPVREFDGAAT